jgi:ABC-type multidrug transport system fused ATPase/permease subunit
MLFRGPANDFFKGLNAFSGGLNSFDSIIGSFVAVFLALVIVPSVGLVSVSAWTSLNYKTDPMKIILIILGIILVELVLLVFFHFSTMVIANRNSKKNAKVIEEFEARIKSYKTMKKEKIEERLKEMK